MRENPAVGLIGVFHACADFKILGGSVRRDLDRILPDRGRHQHCHCHRRQRHGHAVEQQVLVGEHRAEITVQLAFRDRAGPRTGFSAFFGSSFFCSSFFDSSFFASSLAFLPLIGSSISRWPSIRFFGFLVLLPVSLAFAAGALSPSLARLLLRASIRLMTLPLVFGAALAGRRTPARFLSMRSISAAS